jgi:dTDP-4-amino-4,6-dideoxygalactose transaminase
MINLFEPDLGPQELALLAQVAATKWLGRGSYVSEFETLFAEFQKVDSHQVHTISCCSDAIFGVLDILGIHAGDEVIVPSISFPSIGSAVVKAGAQLVITDSCADTGNIDLNKLLGSVTPKTKAVFVTNPLWWSAGRYRENPGAGRPRHPHSGRCCLCIWIVQVW